MFTIATYVALSFKDKKVRATVIALYILRATGDIIFLLTGFQKILLFTPNFLETFIIFYLAFVFATKKNNGKVMAADSTHPGSNLNYNTVSRVYAPCLKSPALGSF